MKHHLRAGTTLGGLRRLVPGALLATLVMVVPIGGVNSAQALSSFTLVAVDPASASMSGASLAELTVVAGALDFETDVSAGNFSGTAKMQGTMAGDELSGTLHIDVRIVDNYGTEFYQITDVQFATTPITTAGEVIELVFGDGTETDNLAESGAEQTTTFSSGQRISYTVVALASEETTTTVVPPVPDSGARFSGLAGEVEVIFPEGVDGDGRPHYGMNSDGTYEYIGTDTEQWNFAKLDMVLPVGTVIRIGDDSEMILSFADMTTFTARPGTTIILGDPTQKDSQFQLLIGNLWVDLKDLIIHNKMEIEMGQAVCGIKGTTLVLQDDGTTSTVKVIEGTVEFTSRSTGATIEVAAGETVSADASGLGPLTRFDIATETANWTDYGVSTADDQPVPVDVQPTDDESDGGSSLTPWLVLGVGVIVIAVGAAVWATRRRNPTPPAS